MARMYNPPHPGEILRDIEIEPLGLSVSKVAENIGVDRTTLSRLLNGRASISVEMALRLSKAFNTTPELWLDMQRSYDLWNAQNDKQIDLNNVKVINAGELRV